MRVLHTSDWHLGRSFHRESLLDAQAAFIDHLVAVVMDRRVDLVVVSGDVYDRALPSVDAVALAGEALAKLRETGARTVLISGNHDSARRLGFGAGLIDASGVHLRTDPAGVGVPVTLTDGHGEVAVYGIPYLEPDLVRGDWELTERGHPAALGHAMSLVRADLATRPAGTRAVVLAHAFVTGGQASDSERDIAVGGVSAVPVSVFDGAHYVALGHLHGHQEFAGGSIAYSGSPMAYSFSEEHQVKGCLLVDLGASGVTGTEFVPAPVPRPIARLRGTLDELLTGRDAGAYTAHWLQVTLTDARRPVRAMERLRERFPHTLALLFEPDGAAGDEDGWARGRGGRSDTELALDFVAEVRGSAADDAERALLARAFEETRTAGAGR